ncbi:MAG TPA: hypothetical protein VK473_02995 [Terriglobales bacterium]|nr:hypothetical protein [Terriglobales bacterium]
MRININLATQAFQDVRRFFVRWGAIAAALAILAALLCTLTFYRWRTYRQISTDIARARQQLARLDAEKAQEQQVLNRPENRDVRERSAFINELIHRKQVSWTKVFVDLEQIMPPHLRVLALRPEVKDDQIRIDMMVGGDSRDRATELVSRMEKSRTFRNAFVVAEAEEGGTGPSSGADAMRFQISAEYVPQGQTTAETGGGQ